MLRKKVLVFVVRTRPATQVLLLKRVKADKGDWHPVTGNVEAHEPIGAAAAREVEEETGLTMRPEPLGLTYTYEVKDGRNKGRYHETCFWAKIPAAADSEVTLSEEHTEHAWLSLDAAEEKLSFPDQKRALAALVARVGK